MEKTKKIIDRFFVVIKSGNTVSYREFMERNPTFNINEKNIDDEEENALMYACENGHSNLLKILLQNEDIIPSQVDLNGDSALHFACYHGKFNCVKILLDLAYNKININQQNNNGNTALHDATKNSHKKIIRLLLSHGINRMTENNNKKIAKDFAQSKTISHILTSEYKDINIFFMHNSTHSLKVFQTDFMKLFTEKKYVNMEVIFSHIGKNFTPGENVVKCHREIVCRVGSMVENAVFKIVINDKRIKKKHINIVLKWLYGEIPNFNDDKKGTEMLLVYKISKNWKLKGLQSHILQTIIFSKNFEKIFSIFLSVLNEEDESQKKKKKKYEKLYWVCLKSIKENFSSYMKVNNFEKEILTRPRVLYDISKGEISIDVSENNALILLHEQLKNIKDSKVIKKDVIFQSSDGKSFPVHRVIMAGRSKYFQILFARRKNEKRINLEVKAPDLYNVIQFVYTSNIVVTNIGNLFGLVNASERMLLPTLKDLCLKIMEGMIVRENYMKILVEYKDEIKRNVKLRELFEKKWREYSMEMFDGVFKLL